MCKSIKWIKARWLQLKRTLQLVVNLSTIPGWRLGLYIKCSTLSGMLKATVPSATFPASRRPPTFTGVLSMLCHRFLEFLSIVYDSFQRDTFVIFISCDVHWRIMLWENRCTKSLYYSLWPPSTSKTTKNNALQFFPLSARPYFSHWISWDLWYYSTGLPATWNSLFLTRETTAELRNRSRDGAKNYSGLIRRHKLQADWILASAQAGALLITLSVIAG